MELTLLQHSWNKINWENRRNKPVEAGRSRFKSTSYLFDGNTPERVLRPLESFISFRLFFLFKRELFVGDRSLSSQGSRSRQQSCPPISYSDPVRCQQKSKQAELLVRRIDRILKGEEWIQASLSPSAELTLRLCGVFKSVLILSWQCDKYRSKVFQLKVILLHS